MDQQREQLLQTLLDVTRTMPREQLREVTDFADFLQAKHGPLRAERGTPPALLRHAGSLRFDPGEMDDLLAEIDDMRQMDLERDA